MSVTWAVLSVGAATAVAVAAMLFVRGRAPKGGYFADGDRAAGFFGVLATGFSVLLGLIVFLAFTSYDQARAGAETEAALVAQQFETAQFMPPAVRRQLGDELVCYGRYVVHQAWPRMSDGSFGDSLNPWAVAMFRTLKRTNPETNAEQSAYDAWVDRTADREIARRDRVHGAVGVIPDPLWAVLFFITGVIFVFALFFADSAERRRSQAIQIGSAIAVIAAMLCLIGFLDHPVRAGWGGLEPVAMQRTLRILDEERRIVGQTGPLPCIATGLPA
ncbi:bestrophin-like domain [Capillimicrobium parvum]|uniref:DUF4239 domain-containing protein n=1 Tax=Capillimicrobium parvum TaxID=2884022 RepID=A0A9E6Y107_9ACTN|nr:hypothetical protein [Capillimicrobium parvum]UGS37788.1 hypothetical protein DSM104329_04209 [Capillimicrobium parvum]